MLEHHKPAKDIYDDGRLFLDFSEQTASLNGKPLTLSPMEYKMLNLFRKNPRQVLTRGQLLEKLWDIDERFRDEHTLYIKTRGLTERNEAEPEENDSVKEKDEVAIDEKNTADNKSINQSTEPQEEYNRADSYRGKKLDTKLTTNIIVVIIIPNDTILFVELSAAPVA